MHPNIYVATRALVEAGYKVTILSESEPSLEMRNGVRQLTLATTKQGVAQQIEEIAPDITLLRGGGPYKAFLVRVARRNGSKVVAYYLQALTNHIRWEQRLLKRLKGLPVFRVTPKRGPDASVPPDPVAMYLPWPVEREGAYPIHKHETPVTIVCVGKLNQPRKNLHLVVDALMELGQSGRVKLLLVGKSTGQPRGHSAQYLKQLEDAEAHNSWIEIRRDVPYEQMADIYRESDICVMPSTGEPLGYAPVEGMAYGAIPVISEQSGSVGYIENGQNGMRVDIEQAGHLEMVLTELVSSQALRQKLSDATRKTAEGELGVEMYLRRFEKLFRDAPD